jgi:hypothetical protein
MIRFNRLRPVACGCSLALLLAASPARADSAGLDWLGVVYLWAPDMGLDYTDKSVDIDFDDVVDKLEIAFLTHVEAQGDDFGGFVDLSFVAVGENQSRELADLNSDYDVTILDLAFVWSPGAKRMTGLELYGGLRYLDSDFSLVVDPVPTGLEEFRTGLENSYTDFLAGVRYVAPLNEQWSLMFHGDLSAGSTEGTYSLGAFAGFRWGAHHFIGGWKYLAAEIEASGGDESVDLDMSGPALAYGFSF